MANVMKDGKSSSEPKFSSKEDAITAIESSRDRLYDFFSADDRKTLATTYTWVDESGVKREWTGRNRLLYILDHEVHHRGKIVLALEQWGFDDTPFIPF